MEWERVMVSGFGSGGRVGSGGAKFLVASNHRSAIQR